jgi:hypothetical protein
MPLTKTENLSKFTQPRQKDLISKPGLGRRPYSDRLAQILVDFLYRRRAIKATDGIVVVGQKEWETHRRRV